VPYRALCPRLTQSLDATVAYGLAGQPDAARACFQRYLDWLDSELGRRFPNDQRCVRDRLELVGHTVRFRQHSVAKIRASRTALGLNENTDLRI
jgi:hypothetical protein